MGGRIGNSGRDDEWRRGVRRKHGGRKRRRGGARALRWGTDHGGNLGGKRGYAGGMGGGVKGGGG